MEQHSMFFFALYITILYQSIRYFYRVKIIDDNIDCVIDNDTTSENLIGFNPVDEYAPQIVGVIDERPQEVRTLDTYKNKTRWKRVGEDEDVQIKDETVNLHQVQNYVEQINKSTLNDILKKVCIFEVYVVRFYICICSILNYFRIMMKM